MESSVNTRARAGLFSAGVNARPITEMMNPSAVLIITSVLLRNDEC